MDNGSRQIINASGNVTVLGASLASRASVAAATEILDHFVEMPELHRQASQVIANACKAEAGCVTSCAAAGICVAVAATMTGDDLARIETLPDTTGLKNQVVIQRGHNCHFGGGVAQMVHLSGAQTIEIGSVNRAVGYQLAGAITSDTAAGLFVVSHQTAQVGMISLVEFADLCHAKGVPVIVDAASECDLEVFLQQGADLVIYSGHKFLNGLTAGIIAGRKDLVRACFLQHIGISRAMKVGREGIASTIAALDRWSGLDHAKINEQVAARTETAFSRLQGISGLTTSVEPDPTGNPVSRVRLKIDAEIIGFGAEKFRRLLAHCSPAIHLRSHDSDQQSLLIDPSTVTDEEILLVAGQISRLLSNPAAISLSGELPLPPSENLQNWPDPPPYVAVGID